eukprot:TRINITY_DN2224_c0_g1_i2.p1 TRINITY_DN2224_c0_g1~~TRINITY_DN2224_c0_g1_i2.p1  ORF type:complete len:490 (-),score=69.40 TRINITY_DN2224_c0_g1_i2:54-1367(-)
MATAYSDKYTTPETCHIIKTVGDYCPREHAEEYDKVVTDLGMLLGYLPLRLGSVFDPSTITWLSEDIVKVDFYTYIEVVYIPATKTYTNSGWYYYTAYIKFEPGTARVLLQYGDPDPEATPALALSASTYTPSMVCNSYIWPACGRPGANYLNDTGFKTVEECIAYTSALDLENKCPFPMRSKTMTCQILHATSALLLPSVHCQHVSPASDKCQDTCMPACANCHENAKCIAIVESVETFLPEYKCQCLPGYMGDGENCEPATCQGSIFEGALYGSYNCSTGKAICEESFTHNPEDPNNLCICPDGGTIRYQHGKPVCVAKGRCLEEKWECSQAYENVQCVPVNNTFGKHKECRCNYGFNGGRLHDCSCPAPKSIQWSSSLERNVCLSPDECTANWHCGHPRVCVVDPSTQIGTCRAPQKRGHFEEWNVEWNPEGSF